MDLQKINVKFFVDNSGAVPLTRFIGVFTSWIQASDGIYLNVADYSHVHAGPGILLLAHDANISMDNTGNRLGLLYNRKQPLRGTNREKLLLTFRTALETCRRIEEEPTLQGKCTFRGNEAFFLINDRLLAPNTVETFDAVKPDLEDLARTLYGGAPFTLQHRDDPKQRFAVSIQTPASFEIASLLKNLTAAT